MNDTLTLSFISPIIAVTAPIIHSAPAGFFDDILNQYSNSTSTWLNTSMSWADVIFGGLIILEISWSLLEVFLQHRDLEPFLHSMLQRFIFVGAAMFLLNETPTMVTALVNDFITIGASFAGAPTGTAITPDLIMSQGFKIASAIWNAENGDGFFSQIGEILPQILAIVLVLSSYVFVATQLLLTEIQVCFVVGGGAFLVGFIGSRWTMPFAETYPRMVIQSAMKLITITLVVALGNNLSTIWIKHASEAGGSALTYITIGTSSMVYALLAWNLPNIMQAFAAASPAISATALTAGISSAVGSALRGLGGDRDPDPEPPPPEDPDPEYDD